MPTLTIPKTVALVVAVLGWGAYLLNAQDKDPLIGEVGVFYLGVGITATVCYTVLAIVPPMAKVYALGWTDRHRLGDSLASRSDHR